MSNVNIIVFSITFLIAMYGNMLTFKPYDYWISKIELTKTAVTGKREIIHPNVDASFLVGVIDGDGYINKKVISITITFHHLDAPLAYYIKKRIGYGIVDNVKDKNAFIYRANLEGSIVIAKLINGKLRTDKINNFYCLLELINKRIPTPIIPQEKDISLLTNSHWLAGFSDAEGSFQVKTINRKGRKFGAFRPEIRLCFQINNDCKYILDQLKYVFGGGFKYSNTQNINYFSVSFGSARKIINYFDHFNLLSSKHVNYIKWRNVYRLIQRKEHLTKNGIEKIFKIKSSMNSLSRDEFEL